MPQKKVPYLELTKVFELLWFFLKSEVLKFFLVNSILNEVIWCMHCGEKSPVNSQLSEFWDLNWPKSGIWH